MTLKEIFEVPSKPIINSILEGINRTIIVYVQKSSGNKHTMQGEIDIYEL